MKDVSLSTVRGKKREKKREESEWPLSNYFAPFCFLAISKYIVTKRDAVNEAAVFFIMRSREKNVEGRCSLQNEVGFPSKL